jgi:RND family efflux transporter MFP subunit
MSSMLGERRFSGLARAETESVLSFRVPGRIEGLPLSVGDLVDQGTIVATLDDAPYLSEVTRIQAELTAAQAVLTNSEEQYKRVATLVADGVYAAARGDEALGDRDGAAATVESVRAALAGAQINLESTTISAPFKGTIVAIYPQTFEEVRAQQQVARLLDLRRIEAVIDVPETLISLVSQIETVAARFDAFPEMEIEAKVTEIGAEASQVTRTFPVTIVMDQPDGAVILPGMSGSFWANSVSVDRSIEAIVIPPSALKPREQGSAEMAVWVIDAASRTVSSRPVVLGPVVTGGVQVAEGLEVGDWVAIAGANSLTEGEEVRLPDVEPAS